MLMTFSHHIKTWKRQILSLVVLCMIFMSYQVTLHGLMYENLMPQSYQTESLSVQAMTPCHESADKSLCQSVISVEDNLVTGKSIPFESFSFSDSLFSSFVFYSLIAFIALYGLLLGFTRYFLSYSPPKQITSLQLQLHAFLI